MKRTPLRRSVRIQPSRSKPSTLAFHTFRDGREVCFDSQRGREEYRNRRSRRWTLDHGICCLCGRFVSLNAATTEHPEGRGMGGAKRDDRVEKIRVAHLYGNTAKGSMSFERYMALPLQQRIANCLGSF